MGGLNKKQSMFYFLKNVLIFDSNRVIEGVISMSCLWSHGKILFLVEVITGQRLALYSVIVLRTRVSIACTVNRTGKYIFSYSF